MPNGFISVGSNIQKEENIPSSLNALKNYFGKIIISSLYETDSVGFEGDKFYNLIVQFNSTLPARSITKILRKIEKTHGRIHDEKKYTSRTLDLDLVLYGGYIISDSNLKIPRDEIECYAFMLEPLAEIVPNSIHPVINKSYAQLWSEFNKTNLRQKKIPITLIG